MWVRATPSTRWPRLSTSDLEVHRDEGLVLDDEDIGRDFGGQFAAGFLDQRAERRDVVIQHSRRILLGEAFQRDQQEGLARPRGQLGKPHVGRHVRVGAGFAAR